MENELSLDAYAKINLVLDVTGRRSDGYHTVRMIMQTIGIHDTLTFKKGTRPGIRLTMNAGDLPTGQDNLIIKGINAALGYKDKDRCIEDISLDIDLEKRIPIAAGMAGGSTDAAAAMIAVNKIEKLGLSCKELLEAAVHVGADVPYCLMGGTVLAEGIGEILTPLPDIGDVCIVIAKPSESVSTKYVYEKLDRADNIIHPDIDGALKIIRSKETATDMKVTSMLPFMGNVLEYVTIPEHRDIDDIKNVMEGYGAEKAMMSGSGPSVFGIFRDSVDAAKACDEIRSRGLAHTTFVTGTVSRGKGETIYA